jgi:hypothetical protein
MSSVSKSSCEKLKTSVTCIQAKNLKVVKNMKVAEHEKFRSKKYSNKPPASLINDDDDMHETEENINNS